MMRLGEALRRGLEPLGRSEVWWEGLLRSRWSFLIGESFAERATIGRLRGGYLEVWVESGPWAQEFVFWREALLGKIRRELGADVREIKIRTRPPQAMVPRRATLEEIPEDDIPEMAIEPLLFEAYRRWRIAGRRLASRRLRAHGRLCNRCGASYAEPEDFCPICRLERPKGGD